MRLAEFIVTNVEPILAEWEAFAGSLDPGAKMTRLALRDDAEAILLATTREMQVAQSDAQQASKSKGHGGAAGEESDRLDNASELHGVGRVGSGFDIEEVVAEYRALRASVLRLWRESLPEPHLNDIDDITRFNESLDQSLAKAVGSYTERVEQSRRMFLAILSHDLRNPLNSIRMAAFAASRKQADAESAQALSQIDANAEAIERLISDLIDFASTGMGSAMPLVPEPVDLESLCREVLEACRSAYPERTLRFHRDGGDLTGEWDPARLRQAVSNLIVNAIEHGSEEGSVELSVASEESTVVLSVHNDGAPIPPDMLTTIFDPLVRFDTREPAKRRAPGSIGLGLYIVREVVVAHAGEVEVVSEAEEGTTFIVRLSRTRPD